MGMTNVVLAIPAFVILIALSIALGSRAAVTVAIMYAGRIIEVGTPRRSRAFRRP